MAGVMVGHDVIINAAGDVTQGSTCTQLVQTVVDLAIQISAKAVAFAFKRKVPELTISYEMRLK
jgi:hypothetical protein